MIRLTATLGLVATSTLAMLVPTSVADARTHGGLRVAGPTSAITLTQAGAAGAAGVRVTPGAEQRGELTLVNGAAETFVGATFGVSLANDAASAGGLDDAANREVGRWLSLGVTLADIAPESSMTIPYTISVPSEATARSATWTVIVRHDGSELARSDIAAEVIGPSRSSVRVASVSAERSGGKPVVAVVFRNDGNIPAEVSGTVSVAALKFTHQFTANVAAQGDALVAVPWTPRNSQSVYEIVVAAKSGSDSVAWSGRTALEPQAVVAPGNNANTDNQASGRIANEDGTIMVASKDQRFDALTIAVIIAIVLAFVWLILEVAASRQGTHGRGSPQVSRRNAQGNIASLDLLAANALSEQLAPLVAAIQQLANSMHPSTASTVDAQAASASALVAEVTASPFERLLATCVLEMNDDIEQVRVVSRAATPTVMAGDAVGEETMNESPSYFTDEEYANLPPGQPISPAPAATPAPPASPASERIESITAATDAVTARVAIDEPVEATIVGPEASRPEIRRDELDAARRLNEKAQRVQAARDEMLNEVALNLSIPKAVLMEWIPDELLAKVGVTDHADTSEAAAMRRENQVLQLEVAILKRAVAHFARS